jgi:hypothetical protein
VRRHGHAADLQGNRQLGAECGAMLGPGIGIRRQAMMNVDGLQALA